MSSKSRVCVDANVFAYRLISYPGYSARLYSQSNRFFQDIIAGKYEGITSNFTELEYRGLIKRVLSHMKNNQNVVVEESTAMNDFFTFINQIGIGFKDSDKLSINTLQQAHLIGSSINVIGQTVAIYHPVSKPHQNPWKSVGGADALMVNLAIRAGANFLATFDRAFAGLNNPSLKTIIVPDVYP